MRKTLDRLTLPGFEPVMTLENPAKPNPPHASQNRGAGGGQNGGQGRAGRGNATNAPRRPAARGGKPAGVLQNKHPHRREGRNP
jgi:hypothetical protein